MKTQHLQFQLIDISSITSVPPCTTPEETLTRIASAMIKTGTNLEIPLLERLGIDEYEAVTMPHVIAAARLAKAMDGKFEMIGCLVAADEQAATAALKQL